jgi:hypothetical protein
MIRLRVDAPNAEAADPSQLSGLFWDVLKGLAYWALLSVFLILWAIC